MANFTGYAGPFPLPSICIILCTEREASSVHLRNYTIRVVGSPGDNVGFV